MVGETLDWVVATLAGSVGAHILAVFLFIAGVLLLTGASVAGVIKATSDSVSTTTRELRDAAEGAARRGAARRARRWRRSSARPGVTRVRAPEPSEPPGRASSEPPRVRPLVGRRARTRARAELEPGAGARAGARPPSRAASPRTRPRTSRASRAGRRARRARAAHAAGPLPPRGHRLARLRLGAPGPGAAHALDRGRRRARTPPARRRSPRS